MIAFPEGFVWGVSTSAYQIEGAAFEDGRGPSVWDTFSHTHGRTREGATGDVACDHYHRYEEDLDLLARLGVSAYRFSVSWPRVLPGGRGRPNRQGLDFYERLVDGLLERGIEPWLCLFHWDLPQALEDRGGWRNRDTAGLFADYAELMASRLGDRVRHFLLLNEPNAVALLGHLLGIHAPGLSDMAAYAAATHHLNLATGMGALRLREAGVARVGTIVNLEPVDGVEDGEEEARVVSFYDAFRNRNCLDPLLLGRYPEVTESLFATLIQDDDMAVIGTPLDFLGVNQYARSRVTADPASLVGFRLVDPEPGMNVTASGWEINPHALYRQLMELKESYGNPAVYVTENGAAFPERPGPGGRVEDHSRIRYLAAHLRSVARAIVDGADVRGYFAWTLLDNFEWAEGYAHRFGLVRVEPETLKRVPKVSFDWYSQVIDRGGLVEEEFSSSS